MCSLIENIRNTDVLSRLGIVQVKLDSALTAQNIAPKRTKRSSTEVAELKKSVFIYSSELATLKHAEELNDKNNDFLLTLFHFGAIADALFRQNTIM